MYVYIYIYIYICIHTCIYIYIYKYNDSIYTTSDSVSSSDGETADLRKTFLKEARPRISGGTSCLTIP